MYSVILMAALTTNGPDAVAFGRRGGGCMGCQGCMGCSGCSGCYGCGGGCFGGGWGACYGGGCSGWGYGHAGCMGWGTRHGGSHSTTTYDYYPGWGQSACYGGCYGSCMGCSGHYQQGCYGGCYGSPVWYGPGQSMPSNPSNPSGNPMMPPPEKKDAPKPADAMPGSARLIIDAPSDANLFIDNMPFRVERDRQFATPTLAVGQTYYYTVRVEMTREGKPVNETRRVLVRANETVRETFGTSATTEVVSK